MAQAVSEVGNIIISMPNWFCAVFSVTFVAAVFYLGALHHQIKQFCKDHPKIQTSLTRISEILLQKNISKDHVYVMSKSPVQLTEAGREAISQAGFDVFYNVNKASLIKIIKDKNPSNLADLEAACKNVMLSLEDNTPKFDNFKTFAYNRGEPISHILFAAAIALRDKLQDELNIKI